MDIIGTMTKILNRLNTWNFNCEINMVCSYPKTNEHFIDFKYKGDDYRVMYLGIEPFRIKLEVKNYHTNKSETVEVSINCNEHDLYFFGQALTKTAKED